MIILYGSGPRANHPLYTKILYIPSDTQISLEKYDSMLEICLIECRMNEAWWMYLIFTVGAVVWGGTWKRPNIYTRICSSIIYQ